MQNWKSKLFQIYGKDDNFWDKSLKVIDILFSSILIILLSPLLLLIGILIKLTSKGPIIFNQKRYGKNAVIFKIYKFRTMKYELNQEFKQATKNDERITVFGSFLKKYSLDELPQLFNVFFGDMSLVGPRPHVIQQNEYYRD